MKTNIAMRGWKLLNLKRRLQKYSGEYHRISYENKNPYTTKTY
jgi:hypothetical protein